MSKKKGIRIGHYRITPLGVGALAGLVVLIAALIILLIVNPFGGTPDAERVGSPAATPTSTPQPTSVVETVPTPTPTVAPTSTPAPRSATIRALGEIAMETDLLKSALNQADGSFDFSPMFSEISGVMGDADYTIADVEGTLGDTQGISGDGEKMHTPSALLSALKAGGVDMLMLSNDHAMDGDFAELQATVQNVADAGLDYVGAYASAEERNTPVIKDINGIKVGFVAYVESLNGNEKKAESSELQYGVSMVSNSNALADIENTRAAGADVIIALVNWGETLSADLTGSQQQIAMLLSRAGVDVIIGYNPHTVQPAMWLEAPSMDEAATNRTLCICATGNFLSNQRTEGFDSGVVFEFTIEEQADGSFEIVNPSYIPTYVWRYENAETGLYEYRTVPAGRWTENDVDNLPEGMSYSDLQRMGAIWSSTQSLISSDVASIVRE